MIGREMKLQPEADTAPRLMLDMAEHHEEGPIQLRTIANARAFRQSTLNKSLSP